MFRLAAIRAVLALSVVFLLLSPSRASPLDFTDADKIGDVIARFSQSLSELIKQAGSEARVTLMLGYQQADASIQSLSVAYSDALKDTIGSLDKEQRKVFEQTQKAVINLDILTKGPITDAINAANDFNTVVGKITISKPLVTRYAPSNIAPADDKLNEVKISVNGFQLCVGDKTHIPKLTVGKTELLADECTEDRLSFIVPRKLFPSDDKKVEPTSAKLEVYYDAARWYWPLSDFKLVYYSLIFDALPKTLGTVVYHSTMSVKKDVQPILFVSDPPLNVFSHDGHNGDDYRCYPLDPKDGWKYDFANAKLVATFNGNENLGKITYWDDVQSAYNICFRLTAAITAEQNWANSTGHLEVYEVRDHDEYEEKDIVENKKLGWGDEYFKLREKGVLEIKLFGEKDYPHALSATDVSILPYLKVVPDTQSGFVYLRPERKWE